MYRLVGGGAGVSRAQLEGESPAPPSNLTRFLDQRAPRMAAAVARAGRRRSHERFEHFLEKVFANPELLESLDGDPALVESTIDLFEHSQYFADQLIPHPDLVFELSPPLPADTPI